MKFSLAFILITLSNFALTAQNLSTTYYNDGEILSTFYTVDELTERVTYHKNGEIKEVAYFLNNEPAGEWKTFSEFGEVILKGQYQNGEKTGTWTIIQEKTEKMYELRFLSGKRISATIWAVEN